MNILCLGKKRIYGSRITGRKGDWHEELFREELARHHNVYFYGKRYDCDFENTYKRDLNSVIKDLNIPFDFILCSYNECLFRGFNNVNIPKVVITAGFFKNNPELEKKKYKEYFLDNKFDLSFGLVPICVDYLRECGVGRNTYLLPYYVDINKHYKMNMLKAYDVGMICSFNRSFYQWRDDIKKYLKSRTDLETCIDKYFWLEYVVKINQCKIIINEHSRLGFVPPRVNETLACGTFLLTDKNKDLDLLGYKDGEHLVTYSSIDELKDKINYYLKHEKEREEIAASGMKFVRENYNMTKRVEKFIDIVKDNL